MAVIVAVQLVAGAAWAAPAPVRLHVTGERLDPKDAKALEPPVRKAAEDLLREELGVALEDDATTELTIELRPLGDAKARDAMIFRVTVLIDGKEVFAGHPTSWFEGDQAELMALVRTRVADAVEQLPEQPEPAVVEDPATDVESAAGENTGDAADDEAATPAEDGPQTAAPRLTLRNVGLGLLIPGGVALGVGIGLVAMGSREVDREQPYRILERSYRPPGVAVTVVGAVAVSAGLGLLIAHALRRRSNGRDNKRLTWSAVFADQAGVMLTGRF